MLYRAQFLFCWIVQCLTQRSTDVGYFLALGGRILKHKKHLFLWHIWVALFSVTLYRAQFLLFWIVHFRTLYAIAVNLLTQALWSILNLNFHPRLWLLNLTHIVDIILYKLIINNFDYILFIKIWNNKLTWPTGRPTKKRT